MNGTIKDNIEKGIKIVYHTLQGSHPGKRMCYYTGYLYKDILDNLNKNNLISFHSKKEMLMPIELMHAFYKSALTFKPVDLKTKPKFKKLGN